MLHILDLVLFGQFLRKKMQHDFLKMRGGGVKGCLQLFRKFFRFGSVTWSSVIYSKVTYFLRL